MEEGGAVTTRPLKISLRTFLMGRDLVVLITGGRAHIGAVATAYPDSGGIQVKTHALPGHREGDLVKELAYAAASSLDCTVTVAMGIHVDRATRDEIDEIVRTVRRGMREVLTSGYPLAGEGSFHISVHSASSQHGTV
jgi:gallate decarboxylase subunit D